MKIIKSRALNVDSVACLVTIACGFIKLSFSFERPAKNNFSLCKLNNCENESGANCMFSYQNQKIRINTNSVARKFLALFFCSLNGVLTKQNTESHKIYYKKSRHMFN